MSETEIPDDIWDAALSAIDQLSNSAPGVFLPSDADVTIAGVILAERERCAKLCEESRDRHMFDAGWAIGAEGKWVLAHRGDVEHHNSHVSRANEAGNLAACIRLGTAPALNASQGEEK